MSDHNSKPMNKEELEKYIEKDFLPSLLSKLPNIPDLVAENARLKAEVERLRKFNDEALAHIAKEERKSRECLDMAQAEVERLVKAGDAMCDLLGPSYAVRQWNAAKEGNQP